MKNLHNALHKIFLRLHFAVDQEFSISGYDLEKGKCRVSKNIKLKYGRKKSDFDFVPLYLLC